jgi:hypothetical protein
MSWVPEAVVANLVQAFRQHIMLQRAAHELVAALAGGPPSHRLTIPLRNRYDQLAAPLTSRPTIWTAMTLTMVNQRRFGGIAR